MVILITLKFFHLQNIACITGLLNETYGNERLKGYQKALNELTKHSISMKLVAAGLVSG